LEADEPSTGTKICLNISDLLDASQTFVWTPSACAHQDCCAIRQRADIGAGCCDYIKETLNKVYHPMV